MIKKICLTTRDGKRVVGCKIVVTSVFETDIENIWCKIQDIDTLREICKPKASFISYDDVPSVWKEGETFCFKLFLHRFIPIGKHTISIIKIDKKSREIVSNEYNKRVTIWNHYIQMEKIAENVFASLTLQGKTGMFPHAQDVNRMLDIADVVDFTWDNASKWFLKLIQSMDKVIKKEKRRFEDEE